MMNISFSRKRTVFRKSGISNAANEPNHISMLNACTWLKKAEEIAAAGFETEKELTHLAKWLY